MQKHILFLNHQADDTYFPIQHFPPYFNHPYSVYNPTLGQLPDSIDSCTHIVISGSVTSVFDQDAWLIAEKELLNQAIQQKKNILGVCFGHQLLATLLFGKEVVFKRETPEFGWIELNVLDSDPLLGEKGTTLFGFAYHNDEVIKLPTDKANVILSSTECPNHAFRYNGHNIWGIQAHFEMDALAGTEFLAKYMDPEDSRWAYVSGYEEKTDSHMFGQIICNFLSLD